MLTKKKILQKARNMRFFDSTLAVNQSKVDTIKPDDYKLQKKYEDELKLAFKLKTIHQYTQLPDSYDILVNPTKVITKAEYKRKVTDPDLKSEVNTVRINTSNYKAMAYHMPEEEWDRYFEAYKELITA